MQKFKYIRKVAEAFPYSYEEPPICKAELWDFSRANENEEARKEAVCAVASISYGGDVEDPEKFWNLLIEKGDETPFKFVKIARWGEIDITDLLDNYFPNDFSVEEEEIGYLKSSIATFKLKIPIFVAYQIQHPSFSYMKKVDEPYATFWVQGDHEAWLDFFIYHLHPERREETRLVAKAMWTLLRRHQPGIITRIAWYLDDEWTQDCNPIFTPARKKEAKWFRESFLKEVLA